MSSRIARRRRRLLVAGLVAACGAVALLVFALTRSTESPEPLSAGRLGSFAQADGLGNTVIGGPGRTQLSFRFRATWTGSVTAIRCYVIKNVNGKTGYSAGTGGAMRVTLESDSGSATHVPAAPRLAAATFKPMDEGFWPLVRFDKPGAIVAGRLYHVVFSNVDPRPEVNYVSINALYSAGQLGRGPRVPDELAVLEADGTGTGRSWEPRRSEPQEYYLPILDVVGARKAEHVGLGYMEVWDPKPIGGDAKVRQLLRPDRKLSRVTGVWLRVRRADAASGPLTVGLERPNGEVLASTRVVPRSIPNAEPGWIYARFWKPVSLAASSDYALTASAASASSYEAFPIRKGTGFGFDRKLIFNGGYAQFNDGNGWVGWDQWGGHDERNSDLQFALDTAP